MATNSLTDQLLGLPLDERVRLAEALWKSIGEDLASGPEREALDQALRRDAELTSRAVSPRSHSEVITSAIRTIEFR